LKKILDPQKSGWQTNDRRHASHRCSTLRTAARRYATRHGASHRSTPQRNDFTCPFSVAPPRIASQRVATLRSASRRNASQRAATPRSASLRNASLRNATFSRFFFRRLAPAAPRVATQRLFCSFPPLRDATPAQRPTAQRRVPLRRATQRFVLSISSLRTAAHRAEAQHYATLRNSPPRIAPHRNAS
jgi:hypothetical protein